MRLEVDITGKTYRSAAGGPHEVLAPIKFAIQSGAVGVLVGPSGCGKSTMLRIILGLDRDFDGHVARPPEARIGMVFQEPRLLPWRSVEQNVRLAAPDVTDGKLSELFRILELEAHRSHFPGELSLGLARRVALARAFAVEPDLLVLDEPLASLDDALAGRLRDEIATLVASRPVMTLLVTHSLEDAIRLGDRLFFLSPRPARIVQEVPIAIPRAKRNEVELARIRAELAALELETK
ncbi:ABC transporter ATP-binding protein [Bradyrhizobium sp. CCBAU 45384]|uniref:ABC transporter ATP-binding protein n=1 Tax=Bradyrhizobium sp. CCBAU 45384 TaxID=858428 RepID=UPI002305AAA3|nr:ATP-binding cassette domain-containing protein [Bradyrhizobium sp. CCBAU 45384]MDA9410419.1 ABC transporter ATP-binding protein [Bradyrhizobium sp. CCBAU 45384]